MSKELTIRMLAAYEQIPSATRFLTGLFQSPAANFHNSAAVEIDISRAGEEISVVVQDLSVGGRQNAQDLYTNKQFVPPIHSEEGALNSFDLMSRSAGDDPFKERDFQTVATAKALTLINNMQDKIRRSVEVQASQILQTGVLNLKDSAGTILYTLDFKPKTAHFPTAGVIWSNAAATPIADLTSLADVIRTNGLSNPNQLIMGAGSFREFIDNAEVQNRFDVRRIDLGTIAPEQMRGDGGIYKGTVVIGNYQFDVWTYQGFYVDPQSGLSVPYVADDKVIMRASSGRMDATYGAIPTFGNPAAGILPYLPPRLSSASAGTDLFTTAWLSPNQRQINVEVGSRPLLIPTAIDTYGCLDTGI